MVGDPQSTQEAGRDQEAPGAPNGGQRRGEERLGRDPLGCHICVEPFSENITGQPGGSAVDVGPRMRARLGLCLGGQPTQYGRAT